MSHSPSSAYLPPVSTPANHTGHAFDLKVHTKTQVHQADTRSSHSHVTYDQSHVPHQSASHVTEHHGEGRAVSGHAAHATHATHATHAITEHHGEGRAVSGHAAHGVHVTHSTNTASGKLKLSGSGNTKVVTRQVSSSSERITEEAALRRKEEKKAVKKAAKRQAKREVRRLAAEVAKVHTTHDDEHHDARRVHSARSSHDSDAAYVVTTKQHFADRIVAIPEIVQREVNEEAFISVPRKVVEREKVVIVKEVVEIPEIEYIDEYVTEEYVQDVHRTIEKPITIEREVEHIVHVDDVETITVEVPEVTYEDVVVVKDVRVPTILEKEKIIEKIVPQIREEIIEDVNMIHKDREVRRNIPVPVEATVKQKFIAPRILPHAKDRSYKVLLPQFSEHAVWNSCLTPEGRAALPSFNNRIEQLAGSSLCEVEKLFCDMKAVKMETDDWLTTEMLESRINLPYQGVEYMNVHKPKFLNSAEEVAAVIHQTDSVTMISTNPKSKNAKGRFCGANSKTAAPTKSPQSTVIKSTQPQFVQVDSHLGHTTISPTVNYARRTPISTATH